MSESVVQKKVTFLKCNLYFSSVESCVCDRVLVHTERFKERFLLLLSFNICGFKGRLTSEYNTMGQCMTCPKCRRQPPQNEVIVSI